MFETGLNISFDEKTLEYVYPDDVFGPESAEQRPLTAILHSMVNKNVTGPNIVYSIAMDVGKKTDRVDLLERELLFGIVDYANGSIGTEPIKSQGHIHAISKACQMSTPEVYEIWSGEAIIYMQETATDDPGRCFAVRASTGEVVIVPPGWAHCTINASKTERMLFGAWCVRDFGFEYADVKAHNGLAFYPKFDLEEQIIWEKNPNYREATLIEKGPREYSEFSIDSKLPIYRQYEEAKDRFDFVVRPDLCKDKWIQFIP